MQGKEERGWHRDVKEERAMGVLRAVWASDDEW